MLTAWKIIQFKHWKINIGYRYHQRMEKVGPCLIVTLMSKRLYNKYKEVGTFETDRNGNLKPVETVSLSDKVVGIDNKGNELKGFKIHFSKTGVHLVPWRG